MILPLHTDSPLRRSPWMNWSIIAANVLMFLAQRFSPAHDFGVLSPRDPHLWQYFTYAFLHANVLHLAGNMLFLYIFGNNVNDRMGQAGYLAFYLAGGVFAGIGHVLTSASPVLGASGAVAAVTGAFLVLLPKSHVTIFFFFFLIGTYEIPSMFFIIASFAMDFIYGFSPYDSGVAHIAHLSGSVFGFFVCFALLAAGLLPRNQFDLFALTVRWNRRRQYRDMVSQGFDPFNASTASSKRAIVNPNAQRIAMLRSQIAEQLLAQQPTQAAKLYLELHAIDPQQVLGKQNQLDVANQLFSQGVHGGAADAYSGYLRVYPKTDQTPQVNLMLGLLNARYLGRPDLAKENLQIAKEQSRNAREVEIATAELQELEATSGPLSSVAGGEAALIAVKRDAGL